MGAPSVATEPNFASGRVLGHLRGPVHLSATGEVVPEYEPVPTATKL